MVLSRSKGCAQTVKDLTTCKKQNSRLSFAKEAQNTFQEYDLFRIQKAFSKAKQ